MVGQSHFLWFMQALAEGQENKQYDCKNFGISDTIW